MTAEATTPTWNTETKQTKRKRVRYIGQIEVKVQNACEEGETSSQQTKVVGLQLLSE